MAAPKKDPRRQATEQISVMSDGLLAKKLDPKLAKVRAAIANDDWHTAIKMAARVTSFGKHAEAIQRGKDAIGNPDFYRQLGRDPVQLRAEAIVALQERLRIVDEAEKTGVK